MVTAMVDASYEGFSYFSMLALLAALFAMCLDRLRLQYGQHQTVVGAVMEGKKKKKKKSRVDVIEALVEGEEGGVVGFVGDESVVDKDGGLAVKGGDLVQMELFDGSLVVKGGGLGQTECFDGSLVVKGGGLEQTECNDSLGELEQTECSDSRLVVESGDLQQTEFDGRLVMEGGELEPTECVQDGGLEQTECVDGRLVVESGYLEQTVCSHGSLVVESGDLEQTECLVSGDSLVGEDEGLEQTECFDGRLVGEGGDLERMVMKGGDLKCSYGRLVVEGGDMEQIGRGVEVEDGKDEEVLPSQGEDDDDDDDDDWVGIEKSDLGERFGSLASFMASEAGEALLGTLRSDVRLQLYALHKVAVEGPCYNRPALVLTSYARAKWYNLYFVPLLAFLF